MVGNIEKTCNICFKKMCSDNLKRHMEKHKILEKAKNNRVAKCSINEEEVEKRLMYWQEEFERKLELGRLINKNISKNSIVSTALFKDEL